MSDAEIFDVAIVGGGPAGLSAAIWLGRYLHRVVLIDSGDPRNWETRGINGFLGHPEITPAELRKIGRDEARRYDVTLVDGSVDRAERLEEERFRLAYTELLMRKFPEEREELVKGAGESRVVEARRLLLAFGIRDIWPDIPGLDRCYGETAHHCPDCDGWDARDRRTVVVASGRKAPGMALALATWTRDIVICTNGERANVDEGNMAKLRALGIPVIETPIARMRESEGEVRQLEFRDGGSIPCERLFFAIGHFPADDLGQQLGCARDEDGLIIVDDAHRSSVPNVFAAGDIIPGPHVAMRAAAGGAVAAMAIHRSLLPELLRLE